MSFAAQLAARAEATKRSSASNIDADALDSTSSISDSIKSRSASTTTNISSSSNSNSRQASNSETTKSQSGWKPKQHHTHNTNTTNNNNKQKKKLVPISDSDDDLLQPSYMNMKSQSSQPQDVKNSNNNNIITSSNSSSSETIAARISSSSVVNEESTIMKSPRIFDQQEQSDKLLTSTSTSKPDTTIMSPLRSTKKASKSDSNSNSSCNIDSIKQQADRYKLENTKLRKEALLLKARLEQQHNKIDTPDQSRDSTLPTNSCLTPPYIPRSEEAADIIDSDNSRSRHQHHSNNNNNSNNLSTSMLQLKAQYKQLRRLSVERIHGLEQMSLLTPPPTELLQKMNSLKLLEEEEPMGRGRGGRRTPENANELVDENVRLTQLLIDIGQLEELAKLRKNVGTDTKNVPQSTQLKSIIETSVEKDNTIQHLQTKLRDIEEELKDVTELKNAEIAVLRKQLDRAEHKQLHDINKGVVAPVGNTASMVEKEEWTKEREGYRDEIRRLNIELSTVKEKTIRRSASIDEDEKELIDYSQYNGGSGSGGGTASSATATNNEEEQQLDSSDISSLQSIIAMMRQTIDQNSREKHELEQRLEEEQQRSQDELQAFAKTLEGVDDLRQSAENMSREIRRIKVKGYRPTRSDLFGGGASSSIGASEGFGELTRAVEASESMADAIRLIEGQNDAMEERRRMDLVVKNTPMKQGRNETSRKHYPGGLTPLPDDDDDGFLSFWNKGTGDNDDDNDDDSAAGPKKERKKKKKSKKKKSDGSVLTSFF